MHGTSKDKTVYIFNHIMKSGGLSFSSYLFNNLKYRESVQLYVPNTIDEFIPRWRNGYYNGIDTIYAGSHFASEAHILFPHHRPCYITMLREPLERFLSSYKMSMDIGIFPDAFTPQEYFRGAWHNFMTLVIGDGDLAAAKRRLAEEYAFVGITEEYDRSVQLLAHRFDLDAVASTHANRSKTEVPEESLTDEFRKEFYRANADDVELYRFGREIFERAWERERDAIQRANRPTVRSNPRIDVMEQFDAFMSDIGGRESFIFRPWEEDNREQKFFWGIVYRMSPLPLMYTLLKHGRYRKLGIVLENLKKMQKSAPYAHPVIDEYIAFFERIMPRGMEAAAGWLAARLGIELSGQARKRLGDSLPMASIGYLSFMETDRMLALSGTMNNRESMKKKIEAGLLDD